MDYFHQIARWLSRSPSANTDKLRLRSDLQQSLLPQRTSSIFESFRQGFRQANKPLTADDFVSSIAFGAVVGWLILALDVFVLETRITTPKTISEMAKLKRLPTTCIKQSLT